MLQKHQQVLILLVGVLYVYSVCPFLCAAFEQNFCYNSPQDTLNGIPEMHGTCCQVPKAGSTGESGPPSESDKSCCSKDLELVFPEDRYNTHESRESTIDRSLVSTVSTSAVSHVDVRKALRNSPAPLTSSFFPDHSLSHRGPPFSRF